MLRYALARVVWTLPVLFVAVTLTFFLVRSIGGDPFRHGPLVGLTAQGGWQKYCDFQPQSPVLSAAVAANLLADLALAALDPRVRE